MPDTPEPPERREGAFLYRGAETTRLETFVDAAFAFALTLLVISFDAVPGNYQELELALRATPAFLFGFLVLTMFWMAHRNWSIRYGLDTTLTNLLSLALVFIILIYVYPLRAMATAAVSALSGGWLPSEFTVSSYAELRGLFVIYGVGFLLGNLCIVGLYFHALGQREALALSAREVLLTRHEIFAWLVASSIGLLSAGLALVVPDRLVGLAGWAYFLLALVMPLVYVVLNRRYRASFQD